MNDLKPVGFFDENAAREELAFSFNRESGFEPVYSIPSTHRVVSVELLERLINHQSSCFCHGHNTCQMCLDFKEIETLINKEQQP